MKKILKYSLVLGVLVSLATTSCVKEVVPTGSSITKEQANASPTALASMTGAIHEYAATANWSASDFHSIYGYPSLCVFREVWGNDVTCADTSRDWYQSEAQNQYQSAEHAHMQMIWLVYTKIIALSNDIIRMFPNLDEINDNNKGYVGAAYAYRALCWLDMAQMYEFKENKYTSKPEVVGLTIPLLDENLTEAKARYNERLPKAEILKHIYASLDKALLLLDGFAPADKTLPSKAVAYGILARAKMYEGDYEAAAQAAQNALAAGKFSPLTKAQWTDVRNGFNSVDTQSSWMLCTRVSSESSVVKTGIINFTSWMAGETAFGYCGTVGTAFRKVDARFYSQIPDTDFRKLSWKAPEGSKLEVPYLPASGTSETDYPGSDYLPEYTTIKFRPGKGNATDNLVGAATDFPMMRMEEMKFIIAECEARKGNAQALVDIVKTRNPEYTCSLTGTALLSEVFLQKRIEFWGEGIVYFDYKRCPEILQIKRGYEGTNHIETARFNCDGLAPWFNLCINKYEADDNKALTDTNNPDPSGTVELWYE